MAIWGFTIGKFHPGLASLFLQELILTFYIEHKPILLRAILSNHSRMGAHSDIIVYLRSGIIYEYRWGHQGIRPFSMPLPMGCPDCGCLQAWKPFKWKKYAIPETAMVHCATMVETVSEDGRSMVAPCTGKVSLQLAGIHRVTSAGMSGAGEWFGRYVHGSNAQKPLQWTYREGLLSGDVGIIL